MSKHLSAVACAGAALVLVWVAAVQGQDFKIGFFDCEKFAQQSEKAKKLTAKHEAMIAARSDYLEKIRKENPTLYKEYIEASSLETAVDEIPKKKILKMNIREINELMFAPKGGDYPENWRVGTRDMWKVIPVVRIEKNLVAVFSSAMVLSADDSLDITEEVARKYDAEPEATRSPAKFPLGAPARPKAKDSQ